MRSIVVLALLMISASAAQCLDTVPLPRPDPRGPHAQRENIPCEWTWGHVLPGGLYQTPCGAQIDVELTTTTDDGSGERVDAWQLHQ